MHVQALIMAAIPSASGPMSASDNFDSYADGSTLSGQGHWLTLGSPKAMTVAKPASDGRFLGANGDASNCHYYNFGTWANDQWAQITIASGGGGGPYAGPAVRCGGGNGYYCKTTLDFGGLLIIYRIDSGTETLLTFTARAYTVGDVVKLSVAGAGSSTRLTASVNGSALISSYDPGATYYSSGFPGIICGGNALGAGDGGTDWSAADI